jgi:O-antigen ligase
VAVVAWLAYSVTGMRPPWQPIVVSDTDAGAGLRQVLFSVAGMVALWRCLCCRSVGALIGMRLSEVCLVAWLLLSVTWSDSPAQTVKRSIVFALGFILLLTLVHSVREPVRTMQRVFLGGAGVAAWVSLIGSVILPPNRTSILERPGLAGVTAHPNTLAPCMAIAILISLGFTPRSSSARALLRFCQLGLVIAVVLCKSMTTLTFLALGLTVFWLLRADGYGRGSRLIALVVVSSIAIGTVAVVGKDSLLEAVGKDASLSGRDVLWEAVFREGMNRPIFGSGFGAFWREGRGREIVGTWNPRQSHNAFLDLFVDLGLVGLLAVLGLVGFTLASAWQSLRGPPRTPQREAVVSMIAIGFALILVYGGGEGFLLKMDKIPFLVLIWFVLLLRNTDENRVEQEFGWLGDRTARGQDC